MHSALKTFVVVLPFLAAAACGGGSTTTTTTTGTSTGTGGASTSSSTTAAGGTGPTGTEACATEAAAVCTLRDTCAPGYDNKVVYGSEATCQTRTAQVCVNALDATGTGNTAAKVEACATAYPTEACADFFDGNPVMACVPAAGTLATGKPCGASAQCESTYCAVTSTSVCATCQPLPVAGATCVVEADCGRDMACATPTIDVGDAGVPTSGKCVAWAASGAACLTGYNPCGAGLSCVGDDEATMTMGTCQAAGATVGAACQTTRKSVAGCYGDLGLVCIAPAGANGMGTCVAIAIVGNGAPCGDTGTPVTGYAVCGTSGLCKKAVSTDTTGTCVAAAADGAACDSNPSIGPPCLSPAKCVPPAGSSGTAGTCTVPNAATCM